MLLSVEKISKTFPVARGILGNPTAFIKALEDISFNVETGQILGIVGESGCGKSTLGRCAVGLYEPTEGKVLWDGKETRNLPALERQEVRRRFQMLFQNPFASLDPRQKVRDLLLEPLQVGESLGSHERMLFVQELLGKVGLVPGDLEKYPHEFSGGQRQRLALARSLACQPQLIVLDEPVSSLDVSVQASILNLLSRLNRDQKISYLFISHDLQVVGYLSHRVMVMYLGRVVEEGETDKVLANPLHPYTKILLKASQGQKTLISGEPPSPVHVPAGCAFHPRCPYVEKRCLEERQELTAVKGAWKVACWKWNQL